MQAAALSHRIICRDTSCGAADGCFQQINTKSVENKFVQKWVILVSGTVNRENDDKPPCPVFFQKKAMAELVIGA